MSKRSTGQFGLHTKVLPSRNVYKFLSEAHNLKMSVQRHLNLLNA